MNIFEMMQSMGTSEVSNLSESGLELYNGILESIESNMNSVNFDVLSEVQESATSLTNNQIKEFCNFTDALTNIYEDISVELEASNDPTALDISSKLGKTKKAFKAATKAAKKNIKAKNYAEAKKNIKEAKTELKEFEKIINQFDKNDIKENVIGHFIGGVIYLINNLIVLALPFIPVVGGIAAMVKSLKDSIGNLKSLINDIKSDGVTLSVFNSALHVCETELRRMQRTLDAMEKNVDKLSSAKDSSTVKESFDIDADDTDLFGFPV